MKLPPYKCTLCHEWRWNCGETMCPQPRKPKSPASNRERVLAGDTPALLEPNAGDLSVQGVTLMLNIILDSRRDR